MASQVIVPHSLRVGEILTVLLGFGFSTLAIGARIYTKFRITRKILLEDYFSVAGYLGFLAYLGLAIVIGKNTGDVHHKAYLSMIETIVYDPTIVFVKTSILLQYVTIFVAHRKNYFHYAVHLLIWTNVIFYVVCTFLYIFQCKPRRKLWIPDTPGHCDNEHSRGVFSGSINVASDFLIFLLPLPILLRLQMPSNKKFRLLFVFGCGLFACIASIVRLVYSIQLDADKDSAEYQLTIDKEGLWAFAEISIGIIVGCMPLIHKCFKHVMAKLSTNRSFNILGSSSVGSSWRRLFSKSSASKARVSNKFFDSEDSGPVAPHIGTLKMTRPFFSSTDRETSSAPPLAEKEFPRIPSPVRGRESREGITRKPLPQASTNDHYAPRPVDDTESAMSTLETVGWLGGEGQHLESESGDRTNATRRAYYDLYSKT